MTAGRFQDESDDDRCEDYYADFDNDLDTDVCQNCGGYFAWTPSLTETWRKHWNPGPEERQPQRCRRCLVDDTWIENA